MLRRITKVKGFGVLDNFNIANSVKPFNTYNLIYGWNGSGKTTLARLFRCLELKAPHPTFENADFSIDLTDGKVDAKTYIHDLDIRVFNQDFVAENLDLFDAQTKPIIFISKEKVEEKKELDLKKIEFTQRAASAAAIAKELDALEKKEADFHKNVGKSIKDFFLGTLYANVTYNKNTSSRIWNDILAKADDLQKFELSETELTKQKGYTLLNSKKDQIPLTAISLSVDIDKLSEIEKEVEQLLATNIVSKVIERLREKPDISAWVSTGLSLHKVHASTECEFCGQQLPPERVRSLDGHFNNEYADLVGKITDLIGRLEKGLRTELQNESHLLYEELRPSYDDAITETNRKLQATNGKIQSWIKLLSEKRANPFLTSRCLLPNDSVFSDFNTELSNLMKIIEEHNSTSRSHERLAEQARYKIECHFVSQAATSEKLKDKQNDMNAIKAKKESEKDALSVIVATIKQLEDDLRSDTLAIEEINERLHKFLGRNHITLERQEEGGYQLKRGGVVAKNLSEGEKTAISLIYFFSKIQENDAVRANQIIILDDPISSFDSNHLFNASSLIKESTEGANQIFVLTHNFWFFKQVRDWMLKKKGKPQGEVSNVYLVRHGVLADAGRTLTKFHSEYQHVFSSVLTHREMEDLDESECFTVANSARRLLEAFTSFKTPHETGLEGALQLGMNKGLKPHQKERIYYFISKYSHLDRIESFDNTIEPLLEESKNVVRDVLWLIKKVDEDHYRSMLKICGHDDTDE